MNGRHWSILAACLLAAVGRAWGLTAGDVADRLKTEFHQNLYSTTYNNLLERVESDGFFQESLTGAYAGMFPRTVGGLVSLFMETGELDRCERLIGCVFAATDASGMERLPHVFDRKQPADPVSNGSDLVQPQHETGLYRLDGDYCGVQTFKAPAQPIRAIEAYVVLTGCKGSLTLSVRKDRDGEPLRTQTVDAQEAVKQGNWVRFVLDPPLSLTADESYCIRITFAGEGRPVWYGMVAPGHRMAGAFAHDAAVSPPQWLDHPDHAVAFAVDTGDLRRSDAAKYPILSDRDEIDGQAHVLMAFGRLAQRRGPTPFEDQWYSFAAKLLDRSTDWPYVLSGRLHADLGLVRNVSLEHSREGRMWDTYDILTQSFMGAALESMIPIAKNRHDAVHEALWTGRLAGLREAVGKHMTRVLDGNTVYLEMRVPNSDSGVPFEGMGWLNFAPVAAQWEGLDPAVLRDTIAAVRQRTIFDWQGLKPMALDWNADGTFSKSVIGKGVGWELDYCRREGDWERAVQMLDFLKTVHTPAIYMECAVLQPDDRWTFQDPGNGEQCSWWCWGMARLRKGVGLSAAP